jgi:hypothetical protein
MEGLWWLPGNDRRRLSGILSNTDEGINLALDGQLQEYPTPADDEVTVLGPPEWVEIPLIHGRTRDWKDVTIFNAHGVTFAGPAPGESKENYRGRLVVIGCHMQADAFSGAIIEFDILNSWSDSPSILQDLHSDQVEQSFGKVVQVRLERTTLAEADIDGGAVRLESGVDGSHGDGSIHLDQYSAFMVELNQPASSQSIVDSRLRPLQDLLILSLGRSARLDSLMLKPAEGDSPRFCDAYFTAVQPAQEGHSSSRNSPWSYSEPSLLTVGSSPVPIPDLLSRWFENWSDLREVIILLHAPHYASFMYSENRFASIFQSAEALHKKRFASQEMAKEKHKERVNLIIEAATQAGVAADILEWAGNVLRARNDKPLWRRIDELVRSTGTIGDAIYEAEPQFAKMAVNARTGVSHGGGSSAKPDSVARHWHGELLSWVIRACLLVDLGAPLPEVEERVLRRGPFIHALDQIRSEPDA